MGLNLVSSDLVEVAPMYDPRGGLRGQLQPLRVT